MQSKLSLVMRNVVRATVVVGAALIASAIPLSSAYAGQTDGFVDQAQVQAEAQAQAAWRENVRHFAPPVQGCYHASYPNLKWEKIACGPVSGYRSARRKVSHPNEQVTGSGYDYSAQAPSGNLISEAVGSFPTVTGVKSEKGAGVPQYGNGGILGANQYTLQLNTNMDSNSAACAGYSGCQSWQQYILVSDDVNSAGTALTGTTDVFIQTWLENYGQDVDGGTTNICPSGYTDAGADSNGGSGDDCYQNSPATVIANQLPITALASLKISGTATTNGTDTATVTYGTQAYSSSTQDSISDIANGWNQVEFNVVGNAGGSRADFNSGSSLTVAVALTDGSSSAPTCVGPSNGGTTGETNNLNLGSCSVSAGSGSSSPAIRFTESN
ncbi:hypothetical protein [Burkholderia alba]|uniref:hypothetical protein n=1 Tax=Burkholderia alba TaxID=2683677 RepID=UPI002B0620A4|nr:hypothetical protein [Burkholderia alba]